MKIPSKLINRTLAVGIVQVTLEEVSDLTSGAELDALLDYLMRVLK